MPGVDAMTDYEKWDQLDLSDDEDGVEVPPNIERETFFRLLREKRRRERSQKADAAAARAERLAELMLLLEEPAPANGGADRAALLAELKALEAQVARDRKARKVTYDTIASEGFDRTFINKEEPPPPPTNGAADADTAKAAPRRKKRTEYTEEEFKKLVLQFSQRTSFAASSSFLRNHADILLYDTTALPLLARMASDAMYNNDPARARQCIQQLLLLQTCQSIGPGPGIDIFFHGLQRNDLHQRDQFYAEVQHKLEELTGHIVRFQARAASQTSAARQASAASPAADAASASSSGGGSVSGAHDDVDEAISTARHRALQALPPDVRRLVEQGNVDMLNGYLATTPLEHLEQVLRTCVEGGLVTFGPGHKIDATHTRGPMLPDAAQAEAARQCEELLLKMHTMQAMPPAVRAALKTNQMARVVAALRECTEGDPEALLVRCIEAKIIVAAEPVLEAIRDVVARRPAAPEKDGAGGRIGQTMQLRQQLLYTCLPEAMQNALRDGDLEAFKEGLNAFSIPEAQALLAECESVGLVERAAPPTARRPPPLQATAQFGPVEHLFLVGALVMLLAAVYAGAYYLPPSTDAVAVLQQLLRRLFWRL